jgi:hypothetical protein
VRKNEENTTRDRTADTRTGQLRFFIASENLQEIYSDLSDSQSGFGDSNYHDLWLINGCPYGELYDDKGTVLLSELRSDTLVRACLFHYKKH